MLDAPAAKKVGMDIGDIDLFEFNEAFAVVSLKFMRELNLDYANQLAMNK